MKKILSVFLATILLLGVGSLSASAKTLAALDLALVIDTTGSMGDDIDDVKANLQKIVDTLAKSASNYRIALLDYRDFPERTGDSRDYPYNVRLDFSSDTATVKAAIDALNLGYGGDWRETIYSALVNGLSELSWRSEASKAAIVIGDAPPLDPEPVTGYTRKTVTDILSGKKTGAFCILPKYDTFAAAMPQGSFQPQERDSLLALQAEAVPQASTTSYQGPQIAVFPIATEDDPDVLEPFEALAKDTGGKSYNAFDSDEVADKVLEAIESMPDVLKGWRTWASWVQWIMRWIFFGWIWMK